MPRRMKQIKPMERNKWPKDIGEALANSTEEELLEWRNTTGYGLVDRWREKGVNPNHRLGHVMLLAGMYYVENPSCWTIIIQSMEMDYSGAIDLKINLMALEVDHPFFLLREYPFRYPMGFRSKDPAWEIKQSLLSFFGSADLWLYRKIVEAAEVVGVKGPNNKTYKNEVRE